MYFNRGIQEFSGDNALRKKCAFIYRVETKEFQKKMLVRDFAIRNLRDSQNIFIPKPTSQFQSFLVFCFFCFPEISFISPILLLLLPIEWKISRRKKLTSRQSFGSRWNGRPLLAASGLHLPTRLVPLQNPQRNYDLEVGLLTDTSISMKYKLHNIYFQYWDSNYLFPGHRWNIGFFFPIEKSYKELQTKSRLNYKVR